MHYFWKAIGLVLVAIILWLVLDKREKDYSALLTLAVCCAIAGAVAAYLQPVVEFVWQLMDMGKLHDALLGILLKVVGVGFVAELTGMVCTDAGNSAMAGMVRLLGSAAMLYLSIPLMQTLMDLIQEILGVL